MNHQPSSTLNTHQPSILISDQPSSGFVTLINPDQTSPALIQPSSTAINPHRPSTLISPQPSSALNPVGRGLASISIAMATLSAFNLNFKSKVFFGVGGSGRRPKESADPGGFRRAGRQKETVSLDSFSKRLYPGVRPGVTLVPSEVSKRCFSIEEYP